MIDADHDGQVARSVGAALREIAAMQAERTAPPVRSARLRLAVIYGRARLVRQRERETA